MATKTAQAKPTTRARSASRSASGPRRSSAGKTSKAKPAAAGAKSGSASAASPIARKATGVVGWARAHPLQAALAVAAFAAGAAVVVALVRKHQKAHGGHPPEPAPHLDVADLVTDHVPSPPPLDRAHASHAPSAQRQPLRAETQPNSALEHAAVKTRIQRA